MKRFMLKVLIWLVIILAGIYFFYARPRTFSGLREETIFGVRMGIPKSLGDGNIKENIVRFNADKRRYDFWKSDIKSFDKEGLNPNNYYTEYPFDGGGLLIHIKTHEIVARGYVELEDSYLCFHCNDAPVRTSKLQALALMMASASPKLDNNTANELYHKVRKDNKMIEVVTIMKVAYILAIVSFILFFFQSLRGGKRANNIMEIVGENITFEKGHVLMRFNSMLFWHDFVGRIIQTSRHLRVYMNGKEVAKIRIDHSKHFENIKIKSGKLSFSGLPMRDEEGNEPEVDFGKGKIEFKGNNGLINIRLKDLGEDFRALYEAG